MKYVIARGNPFEGINLTGPFDTWDDAQEYGEEFVTDSKDWWIIELNEPVT